MPINVLDLFKAVMAIAVVFVVVSLIYSGIMRRKYPKYYEDGDEEDMLDRRDKDRDWF
jgi:CBS-domain-containing membrane protein